MPLSPYLFHTFEGRVGLIIDIYIYKDKLRTLLLFKKYETIYYDIFEMRRYSRNILQWSKNDMKSTKKTNGDY